MGFEITQKVALVTGGASGLGYQIVKTFLEKGAKGVAFLDVDEQKGREAEEKFKNEFGNDSCIFIKTDVSEETQMKAAFELTVETFKQLDIVINNAAILNEINWKKTVCTNLGGNICGTLLAIDDYLPKHKKGEEAILINVSSIAGVEPFGMVPIYSTTKHAIVALNRCFGQEEHYQRTKVKVIAVCPGHMDTPLSAGDLSQITNAEYTDRFSEIYIESNYPSQKPEFVAQQLPDIMKNGANGSIWIVENSEAPYEVVYPKLRKDVHV